MAFIRHRVVGLWRQLLQTRNTPEEAKPTDALILNFQPAELWESDVVLDISDSPSLLTVYICVPYLFWGGVGVGRREGSTLNILAYIVLQTLISPLLVCFWFTFLQFFSVFIFPPDFSFMVASMFEICLREKGLSFLRITYRYIFLHFFPFECYFQCIT